MYAAAAASKSCQSCPTLCDPIDGSPPGSPIPGILQVRTLERVAISLSNAWKWKVKVKSRSRVRLLATPWTAAYQAPPSMGFSRQEYWSGVPLPWGRGKGWALGGQLKRVLAISDCSSLCFKTVVCVFVAQSYPTFWDPMDCSLPGSCVHGILQARILEWVAIAFSRGIFLTQALNPGLLHLQADSLPSKL